jgi:hypothetical protein
LRPIEPTNTVFRINLQELGWDRQPYPEAEQPWRSLNLFDLILLEYPHGRLPTDSPFYRDNLLQFLLHLQEAGQVRPVPYVRADWLAEELAQHRSPLYQDLHQLLLGKPPNNRPIQDGSPRPDPLGAKAIAAGGSAIVPLDGLTYPSKPNSGIQFRAIDFQQRDEADPLAKDVFTLGDEMALWVNTNREAIVELAVGNKGRKALDLVGRKTLKAKKAEVIPLEIKLEKGAQQECEQYTIYAYPTEELKATKDFPKGTRLRAKEIHDRIVHPLYRLRPDGQEFESPDPGKMVKMTITITTQRKKD